MEGSDNVEMEWYHRRRMETSRVIVNSVALPDEAKERYRIY